MIRNTNIMLIALQKFPSKSEALTAFPYIPPSSLAKVQFPIISAMGSFHSIFTKYQTQNING